MKAKRSVFFPGDLSGSSAEGLHLLLAAFVYQVSTVRMTDPNSIPTQLNYLSVSLLRTKSSYFLALLAFAEAGVEGASRLGAVLALAFALAGLAGFSVFTWGAADLGS